MKVRIAIADDHPVVRRGLSQYFEEEEGLDVVGQCADGDEMVHLLERMIPDVAVVDLRMPNCSGLDVLRWARERSLATRVVLLAGNITDDEAIEAMRLGVKGIVLKEAAPTLLVQAIRKVAAGGVWLDKDVVSQAMGKLLDKQARLDKARSVLTPREIEILGMVVEGRGNREVGEVLFISEGTVKTHLRSMFEKLGVRSRMQLAAYARDYGLIESGREVASSR